MLSQRELANAIRILSVDAVEQASSGHPGMPLGMADIATVLWQNFLRHHPGNPRWFNRDRFILSNGHGAMLHYALLHLTGYALTIDDIAAFRQWGSKTPGHPEYGHTPGVETTTGPLGQGLGNAVGMAIAEKHLAARFNQPGLPLVDHFTYVFVGDGCLMEGISHEVCSLAGTLALGKLIVFYDDNGISIDGPVENWYTEDVNARFEAYHWHVIGPINGHDPIAVERAIIAARQDTTRPTLIRCRTTIGFSSALAGSEKAHGAPLGKAHIAALRETLGWSHEPFVIPDEIYAAWDHHQAGKASEDAWLSLCEQYKKAYPREYTDFLRQINGDLPDDWQAICHRLFEKCAEMHDGMATRKSSQICLTHFAAVLPELLGGSADLTTSNNTDWPGCKPLTAKDPAGNYLHYGVREFGMAAIMNGLVLHGGVIPYGGTFLVFADYARNAMRLSALMQQRVIYVLTHDSIGLGEDGPTHQPIEHAAMLRMTPNMTVWRPADILETAVAWQQALMHHTGPSCLLLSRQTLPRLPNTMATLDDVAKGAYILLDTEGLPDAIIIATGSEVQIALGAAKALSTHRIRVVSMPCCERFLATSQDYQTHVLPDEVRCRIAIEAGATSYWYRFVGLDGQVIGLDRFGASAPAEVLFEHMAITVTHAVNVLRMLLA